VRDVEEVLGWNVVCQEPKSGDDENSREDVDGGCSPDPGPVKEDEVGTPRGQVGGKGPMDENDEEELKNELEASLKEIACAVGGDEVDPSSIVDDGDTRVSAGTAVRKF
jgi:hypothetical protein